MSNPQLIKCTFDFEEYKKIFFLKTMSLIVQINSTCPMILLYDKFYPLTYSPP